MLGFTKKLVMLVLLGQVACGPNAEKGEVDESATQSLEGDLPVPECTGTEVKIRLAKDAGASLQREEADPAEAEQREDIEFDEFTISGDFSFEGLGSSTDGGHVLAKFGPDKEYSFLFSPLEMSSEGGDFPARGYVIYEGVNAGNCEDPEDFVSKLTVAPPSEDGLKWPSGSFVLRKMRSEPYCDTEVVAGTVSGCWSRTK